MSQNIIINRNKRKDRDLVLSTFKKFKYHVDSEPDSYIDKSEHNYELNLFEEHPDNPPKSEVINDVNEYKNIDEFCDFFESFKIYYPKLDWHPLEALLDNETSTSIQKESKFRTLVYRKFHLTEEQCDLIGTYYVNGKIYTLWCLPIMWCSDKIFIHACLDLSGCISFGTCSQDIATFEPEHYIYILENNLFSKFDLEYEVIE